MHKGRFILLFFIFSLFFIKTAYADVIYLRDDQQIEGLIINETEEEVFIDIGAGTISFNKDEIRWIERGDKNESKEKRSKRQTSEEESEKLPSAYVERLFTSIREIKAKRYEAIQNKKECRRLYRKYDSFDKKYTAYSKLLENLGVKAKERHAVGNIDEYNNIIIRMNTLRIRKSNLIAAAQEVFEERIKEEKKLFDIIQDIFSLQYRFNENFLQIKEKEISPEDKYYYKELEKEAQSFVHDFRLLSLNYTEGHQGALVDVFINNRIKATFIIDLNLPVTMVSNYLARELHSVHSIPIGKIDFAKINVSLGEAEPLFLNSLKIGELRLRNVTALALDTLPYPQVDGILGISFLKHCIVRLDKETKKLILYEFAP